MRDVTAQTFAEDGMALSATEQRHGHVLPCTIDLVIHGPGDQPGAGHGGHRLREHPIRIKPGYKGLRTEDMRDKAGRDPRCVVRANRGQRRGAA